MIFPGRIVMYRSPVPIDGEQDLEAQVVRVEGSGRVRGGQAIAALEFSTPAGRRHYKAEVPVLPNRDAALQSGLAPVAYLLS
jgi:hypothetical protein